MTTAVMAQARKDVIHDSNDLCETWFERTDEWPLQVEAEVGRSVARVSSIALESMQ
jgi:hypothetical protein